MRKEYKNKIEGTDKTTDEREIENKQKFNKQGTTDMLLVGQSKYVFCK